MLLSSLTGVVTDRLSGVDSFSEPICLVGVETACSSSVSNGSQMDDVDGVNECCAFATGFLPYVAGASCSSLTILSPILNIGPVAR